MSFFYISKFVGTGREFDANGVDDPFRAPVDTVEGIIDLRGDSTRQAGFCLVATSEKVVRPYRQGMLYLGDDPTANLPVALRDKLAARLSLTLAASSLADVAAELLLNHGTQDMDRSRWNRLKFEGRDRVDPVDGRRGKYREIHLGRRIWEQYYKGGPGTAITESFNQADSTTLGPDLTWTEIAGDLETVSNQLQVVAKGSASLARADSDLATDDHYVEIDVTTLTSTGFTAQVGIYCRMPSTADFTGYVANRRLLTTSAADATIELLKVVLGAGTSLAGPTTQAIATPETVRVSGNGSTIKSYTAGTERQSVTDTAITGNVRGGVRVYESASGENAISDNFAAADLAAGINYTRTVTDPVGVTDITSESETNRDTVTETVAVTDATSRAVTASRTLTESADVTDAITTAKSSQATATDSAVITDSVSVVLTRTVTATDPVGVADSTTAVKTATATITDPVTTTDAVSTAKTISETITDPISITDATAFSKSGDKTETITEAISVTDSVSRVAPAVRSITEAASVTDATSTAKTILVTVTEAVSIIDATSAPKLSSITIIEPVSATDIISRTRSVFRVINEPILVTDSPSRIATAVRTITDPVAVTDSTTKVLSVVGLVTCIGFKRHPDPSLARNPDNAGTRTPPPGGCSSP